jgi:NodT family efflux transporter outer membrane factor (OMF) lipoprotein
MSEPRAGLLLVLAVASLSAACAVGPDYKAPTPDVPPAWSAPMAGGLVSGSPGLELAWWESLGDPQLDDLVARAVAGNTDVKKALASIRAARAVKRASVAALFPILDATADYQRRKPSGTTFSPTQSREYDSYSAGFDSAWEVDLFGGVRRSIEETGAEAEAAGADLHEVLVTLVADVARNYVDTRSLQQRIAIARANAESQQETLDIARWRFQAGLAQALDVDQAEYNLAETRSRVPALEIDLAAARNRIAVLLGRPAGSVDGELEQSKPVPVPPPSVAVGVPADLLRRRPDVASAERKLAAATAAVGVATADLYPKLSLTGAFSVSATDFGDLGSPGARGFSVGPTLRWNIFDAGRLRAVVAQKSAEVDEALATWESVVLAAGEEAENALVAYAREQEHRDRLLEARTAARRAWELARMQYENGLVDFQRVLDAQRATLGFEESLAISEAQVTTNLVALYKAVGGGWQVMSCGDDSCLANSSDVGGQSGGEPLVASAATSVEVPVQAPTPR